MATPQPIDEAKLDDENNEQTIGVMKSTEKNETSSETSLSMTETKSKNDGTFSEISSLHDSDHSTKKDIEELTVVPSKIEAATNRPVISSFLGWSQVGALVKKNFLMRLRTPLPTFFELFSPALMMLVLVAAYSLSEVTDRGAKEYTQVQVDVPGPWLDLVQQAVGFINLTELTPDNLTADSLIDMTTRRTRENMMYNTKRKAWNVLQDFGLDYGDDQEEVEYSGPTPSEQRKLQFVGDDGLVDDELENVTIPQEDDIFSLLNDAHRQVRRLLKKPLQVPSFSQYVAVSDAISSLIDPADIPAVLADSSFGHQWGNLLTLGTLHLSPSGPVVDEFHQYLNATYPNLLRDTVKVRIHDDETEALDFIKANLNERTWALLDFSSYVDTHDFRYKIRMNYTTLPNTNQIVNFVSIGLNTGYQRYYLSGYLTLQRTLNEFAFSRTDNCTETNVTNIWSMPMPTGAYSQNAFFQAVGYLLGLTIAMAYLYPTSRTIKSMVEEKETRMKETLYILGVRPWAHWTSWLLTSLIVFAVTAILVTWILSSNVLLHSNPVYLLSFFGFFSTATVGFCFVVASFFSKAKLAAIVGPIALFATLLPRFIFFGSNRYEAITAKMWASLLPCTAFAFGADILADYEYSEVGVQEWNSSEGAYSFDTAVGFLVFDTILYLFLGWYLELVIPRQYGVARPWYFLLLPSYWQCIFYSCFGSSKRTGDDDMTFSSGSDVLSSVNSHCDEDVEKITDPSMAPKVRIKGLVKRYNTKQDVPAAVNDLNLSMYESQITCLLGHNGAGKSSTISVLTGLYPPTSGDATIYGNSVARNIDGARMSMGICPQHNVLFDRLTVSEHLSFFQKIKGIKSSRSDIQEKAEEVGLDEYLRTTSSALSGGNKRKLSLAIAFCGDPKFLLLDEPTSGMDVNARRSCWDLLRRKRKGRVILLVSHFLEEAALLGDRIAIMKQGQLRCAGSLLFLQKRFGLGYNLTTVLKSNQSSEASSNDKSEQMEEGISSSIDTDEEKVEKLYKFLKDRLSDTQLIRRSARELTFRFPPGTESSFPDLFEALEADRENLSIGAYGVSNTTLEEVFLQLAEDSDDSMAEYSKGEKNVDEPMVTSNQVSRDELQNLGLFKQIGLLFHKRYTIQRRDLRGFFFAIILPVILCAMVLLVLTISIPLAGPAINMSVDLYKLDSNGVDSSTDIVVGGGESLNDESNQTSFEIITAVSSLESTVQSQYPNAKFVHIEEALSSSDISQHLLDSYNDHSHNVRYGAYAFNDIINMSIGVDWDEILGDIRNLTESSLKDLGIVDISSLLGIASDDGKIEMNFTVTQFQKEFLRAFNLSLDDGINVTTAQQKSHIVLDRIIQSSSNSSKATVMIEGLRASWSSFEDILDGGQNSTNSSYSRALEQFINDTISSLTDGKIQDLNRTSPEQVSEAIMQNNVFDREEIVKGMVEIFEEIFGAFQIESANASQFVDGVVSVIDTAFGIFGLNGTEAPGNLLVIPVIIIDDVLEGAVEGLDDGALIVGDFFEPLNDLLGGTTGNQDGFISLSINKVEIDFSSLSFVAEGISLETASEVLYEADSLDFSLNTTLVSLIDSLLPSDSQRYHFALNSAASVLHNSSSPHAICAFNQAYMEYLFKRCVQKPKEARLVSVNHPLPLTDQETTEIKTILSVLASLFLLIPYCYIPGAFIVFLVKERVSKSKHLQLVSGVNMSAYWVSAYLWDISLFLLLTLLVMAVFLMYGRDAAVVFVGDTESFFCSMALTSGYGLSVLPYSYLLSRMFNNHSSAQIAVMALIFISGFVAVNAYFILSSIEDTEHIAEGLLPFLRTQPAFNIGEGFIQLSGAYWEREIMNSEKRPFDWDVAGRNVALLYLLSLPYFFVLLMLEYSNDGGAGGYVGRGLRWLKSSFEHMMLGFSGVRTGADGVSLSLDDGLDNGQNEDEDVAKERKYVIANQKRLKEEASVLMVNLWKIYPPSIGLFGSLLLGLKRVCRLVFCGCVRKSSPNDTEADTEADTEEDSKSTLPKRAVRGTTTAIMPGETYGLLGVNGAGKTTTLGMLTGDIGATAGEAYVVSSDVTGMVSGGVTAARQNIGFCPQVDPLLDLMTGRETLRMFGRLRGIVDNDKLEQTVNDLLDRLTLTPHADKISESYSGGNKRKLSLGVALIGDPKVLFIDEASSGMDPKARRHMWSLIEEVSKTRSVILTSHSLEEAEALCTRLTIMVKGVMLCLGSVQHLKTKFLDGYTIDVQCDSHASDSQVDVTVATILQDALPGAQLSERHGRFLRFDLPSLSCSLGLASTFRRLQELKNSDTAFLENYSISQCSLEQVFLKLVQNSGGVGTGEDTEVATTVA